MKKLLFLLVLTVLSFATRAQVVNVKNTYACTVQVTFFAANPNCQRYTTSSFPVTVPPGVVVPVNLGAAATWTGIVPPPGSVYASQICVVCSSGTLFCNSVIGCPPCFNPHLGPVSVPASCCPTTMQLQADWVCTTSPLQLLIHP
jgi:hypothetical protein